MNEAFQVRHAVLDSIRRWWNECRISRTGSAQPVLGCSKLAGLLVGASPAREQPGVHLAKQPVRQGESVGHPGQSVIERIDVVRYLDDVVERDAGRFADLEQQQVRK